MKNEYDFTEEDLDELENCAQSSTVPQLWSADGGEPVSISTIVKNKGKAKNKDGKYIKPKKWQPHGLDSMVNKWKPTGKADDHDKENCVKDGCELCN